MAFAPVEGLDNFPGGGKKQIPSLRYGMTSKGRCGYCKHGSLNKD